MDDGVYNWIYKVPCIISVLVNLVFLAIIVRVLVSKLHTDVSERAMLVKTARAIGELSVWSAYSMIELSNVCFPVGQLFLC